MSQETDDACGHGSESRGAHEHAAGNRGDSAGVPWEGRSFESNPHAGDDGSADPALLDALLRFRAGSGAQTEVVDAFRTARVLIPLIAEKGVAVWLKADQDLLWSRVKRRDTRPLLRTADPYGTLGAMMVAREPAYAKADLVVEARPECSVEATAGRVREVLATRPDVLG